MKIGVISDIHSNIDALIAVMNFFKEENVEAYIVLGDVIGIGPYPEKCVEYLEKDKKNILAWVNGNHEGYALNGLERHNHKDAKPMSDEEMAVHIWNHKRLTAQELKYLRKLKEKEIIEVEGHKILAVHYPKDEEGTYKEFIKVPNADHLNKLYDDDADIYLFGHTHKEFMLEDNKKNYINPGSLGCPMNTTAACCGILEITKRKVKYEQHKVKYDIDKVIADMKELKYPLYDKMISIFYNKEK